MRCILNFDLKSIAIIGGAGFVGSRLTNFFDRTNLKNHIYDINIKDGISNVNYLDVEDEKSLVQLKGASCIINLAAVHRDDIRPVSRYDDVNVQGAVNVCNAARALGIKKIKILITETIEKLSTPSIPSK